MINWWLIVVACVMSLLILGLSVYFVVIFVAEADKSAAWFPKAICVAGLFLACVTVLLLPFDVANRRDPTSMERFGGNIDTELMWMICLWTVAGFVVVIIPFATFFYEAYDPDHFSFIQQCTPAFLYTFGFLMCFTILLVVLWITVGFADIPYYSYTTQVVFAEPFDIAVTGAAFLERKAVQDLEIRVSIFVYCVGLLAFLGWMLFMVYGGVGLTALPVDIFADFINRPKPIGAQEFNSERERTAQRAQALLDAGKKLGEQQRKKNNNSVRNKINAFKAEVYLLENNWEKLRIAYVEQGGSIFITAGKLLLGVFGLCLSLCWIMHIFLYNALRLNPFLNTMLTQLDSTFTLLGTVAYGILAFYLLWCTIAGCIKVGMRIVFFQIHPMKLGDTLMNALLFNVGLILLCSVTVTHFCALSFRHYASNTAVDTLLNVYVRRLRGIGVVMIYFQYVFVAIAVLSIFWVILCPRSKVKEKEEDEDE